MSCVQVTYSCNMEKACDEPSKVEVTFTIDILTVAVSYTCPHITLAAKGYLTCLWKGEFLKLFELIMRKHQRVKWYRMLKQYSGEYLEFDLIFL